MSEQLDLTVPITIPNTTAHHVSSILLDWDAAYIAVVIKNNLGVPQTFAYQGATAIALMTILNTSNLSTSSLHKRILQKLVADGFLPAGNVTGIAS